MKKNGCNREDVSIFRIFPDYVAGVSLFIRNFAAQNLIISKKNGSKTYYPKRDARFLPHGDG